MAPLYFYLPTLASVAGDNTLQRHTLQLQHGQKQTMKRIRDIEDLEPTIKDKLIYLANAVIRDAKTGKAYT